MIILANIILQDMRREAGAKRFADRVKRSSPGPHPGRHRTTADRDRRPAA